MNKNKKTLPVFTHEGDGKKEFVQHMFDDISSQYDFLNHFLDNEYKLLHSQKVTLQN